MKNVTINLVSTQSDGENSEKTELYTKGTYKKTASGYVIAYNETETTGYEGSKTTLEVFGNEKVVMLRDGAVESNLVAEKGVKHHCQYGTLYGDFMVGVNTKEIISTLDKDGGHLSFKYVVDINSSFVGEFEISIDVK